MSFTGDLEHLPIVDVIQLLNATRKSGTLTIKSSKGESGLVFKDGYIVSANHLNDSVRVGKILVEQKVIAEKELVRVLSEQKNADTDRKPLIAMLIEKGMIQKGDGFSSLETLIEMTIVEILTWGSGTFSFDMGNIVVSDEYRYFPENLQQEVHLDAQSALMDALRIYDEKKRDGHLEEGDDESWSEEPSLEEDQEEGGETDAEADAETGFISEEDLGLDELDRLERKIPDVFRGLEDTPPKQEPPDAPHRRKIQEVLPWLGTEGQERLVAFLTERAAAPQTENVAVSGETAQTVVLLSADPLLNHALPAVCAPAGVSVFTTNEAQDLDPILDHYLAKTTVPYLVVDRPEQINSGDPEDPMSSLRRQKRQQYPQVPIIQLVTPGDYRFSLQAFADGARAIFPRPLAEGGKDTFEADILDFLEIFPQYLTASFHERNPAPDSRLAVDLAALRQIGEPAEVVFALLRMVSEMVERALTLVVRPGELIAERGIGIRAAKSEGPSTPLGFRIPLEESSLFQETIDSGKPFLGAVKDAALQEALYKEIGAPQSDEVLILPVRSRGKTLTLIYGDFGAAAPRPLPADLVGILADHAGMALENAVLRKVFQKREAAR